MNALILEPNIKEPKVNFDPVSGLLEISGRSIPENSFDIYQPILSWLTGYVLAPAPQTIFEFKLNYFNSSSAEYILDMLRQIKGLHETGHAVEIRWHYDADDEDMQQVAEDFKEMLQMPVYMFINEPEVSNEEED